VGRCGLLPAEKIPRVRDAYPPTDAEDLDGELGALGDGRPRPRPRGRLKLKPAVSAASESALSSSSAWTESKSNF